MSIFITNWKSTTHNWTAVSDIDFFVEFSDTLSPGYSDRYLNFALAVEHLLGRPVDLVTPRALANPYFTRALRADQKEIYAA
jgi:predicted nucleotidyltransferase